MKAITTIELELGVVSTYGFVGFSTITYQIRNESIGISVFIHINSSKRLMVILGTYDSNVSISILLYSPE
jgi:hypothetical protein